jgi:geranylgeranyl transferase type-1 subunit beta
MAAGCEKDVQYFTKHLFLMPDHYTSIDTNRMCLAYFAVSALDLLNSLDAIPQEDKRNWIEWIYAMQIHPNDTCTQ